MARNEAASQFAGVLATTQAVNELDLLIKLKPRPGRQLDRKSFELSVRPIFVGTPDILFTFMSDSGAKEVSIYLAGNNAAELSNAALRLEAEMRTRAAAARQPDGLGEVVRREIEGSDLPWEEAVRRLVSRQPPTRSAG